MLWYYPALPSHRPWTSLSATFLYDSSFGGTLTRVPGQPLSVLVCDTQISPSQSVVTGKSLFSHTNPFLSWVDVATHIATATATAGKECLWNVEWDEALFACLNLSLLLSFAFGAL